MEPIMKIKIKFWIHNFLCSYINMDLSSPKQYYFCLLKLRLLEEIPEIVQFWTAVTTLVL